MPREQVLTIASDFGGLESMQFSPGLESWLCGLFIMALDFQKKLAILETLYLYFGHLERDRL